MQDGQPTSLREQPIAVLWGISDKHAQRLSRLGITTLQDILLHAPARFLDYRTITSIHSMIAGQEYVIKGTIEDAQVQKSRTGLTMVKATITDNSGSIECTWFNQRFLVDKLIRGQTITLAGKADRFRGTLNFQPADFAIEENPGDTSASLHFGRLVPIYPETDGISSKWLRHKVSLALAMVSDWPDFLPPEMVERQNLMSIHMALQQLHFPDTLEKAVRARERFAFEELFLVQVRALECKRLEQSSTKNAIPIDKALINSFVAQLPYTLTKAQKRVAREILKDMEQPFPMRRLLEGDVGSGKTVIGALAMVTASQANVQAALMVPTELLAEQHFRKLSELLNAHHIPIGLLTSSKSLISENKKALLANGDIGKSVTKATLQKKIQQGKLLLIVGTQALLHDALEFKSLGLVIIDEQHRFGVRQRTLLQQKQETTPDLLMMTATPIPRSLALAVYGDLDLSVIDELPPGRQTIITRLVPVSRKSEAYTFIKKLVAQGRQAYVVCPVIDESDKNDFASVLAQYEVLKTSVYPDLRVALLHGRMKTKEKDSIMRAFSEGNYDVLVSTTVIEVGIDVPNATVMLIEGAERYGLAQLHQLRGRVGRGAHQSYCLLTTTHSGQQYTKRLQQFVTCSDGFALAEADLQIRGPGEVYGVRQSGLPDFRMASLTDAVLIAKSRAEAQWVVDQGIENFPLLKELFNQYADREVFIH